jgi:hypothetical protein
MSAPKSGSARRKNIAPAYRPLNGAGTPNPARVVGLRNVFHAIKTACSERFSSADTPRRRSVTGTVID